MKKLNILFFLTVTIFAFGQSKNGIKNENNFEDKTLEVPFQYVNNLLIVDLKVNGTTEKFIFDTGAFDLLTKKFAEKLNLNLKRKGRIGGYMGKMKAFETSVFMVEFQDRIFTNHPFRVLNLKFIDDMECAGLIGEGFIKNLGYETYNIDYKNQKLVLGTMLPQDFHFSFKIRERGYLRIEVGKKSFLIDTGNPLFGEVKDEEFVHTLGCCKYSINSLSITNSKLDLCKTTIEDLQGKSLQLSNFKIKNRTNVIGNLSLQNYLVHIDRKNNKVYLKKNDAFPTPNDLYFISGNNGFFVAVINENSDAYKIGLREGDLLVDINDGQISELQNSVQLHHYLLNHTTNLIVKRGGSELQFNNLKIN